ncbi:SPFH domain-containing protein [Streptomyces sp. NPDC006798]|uniref:SPFH domain-containing protein n=1 Tax=Streptomyces sp. NPDC006798 TaxID=3155462 RepID=UPI0033E93BF9
MSTTTSEPEGGTSPAPPASTPAAPDAAGGPVARIPAVADDATTEIPVHLLFRDDPPGGPSAVLPGGTPTTEPGAGPVGRGGRPGRPGHSGLPGDGGSGRTITPRPAVVARRRGTGEQPRTAPGPGPGPGPGPVRPVPPAADPDLVERPGPALPGWTGVFAGACAVAGTGVVLWGTGVTPAVATRLLGLPPAPYAGIGPLLWALIGVGVVLTLFTLGGVARGRAGYALVLTLFGEYRGTVRRTGLMWLNPLLRRRRIDVRLRHWRSLPLPAADADGTELRVVVLVVWRVRDTARAALGVERHERYLAERVESAAVRILSRCPADALPQGPAGAEALGAALTELLAAECAPAGIEVFSARPAAVEYAPEVAAALQRRRIAAIDARCRDSVLTSVVDAVDDTVTRLTARGLVELDDYERKALVKDLTVAFYTGRSATLER